ncbi:unnamed protein product [Diplocarpon coronariae]
MLINKNDLIIKGKRIFKLRIDLSSQIGYIIVLAIKEEGELQFTLKGNILYYSSTKYKRLSLLRLPTIIYTDSLSLYKCIIKLGTIKEKRLIIDIIAIRQLYENRELIKIY